MKKAKILISAILILATFLSLTSGVFAAGSEKGEVKDYPTVLVHGLMGWGMDDGCNELFPFWGLSSGSMLDYLNGLGYKDIVDTSVGPISSVWDRCCELYAQLTGTRVDYGQAHADKVLAEFKKIDCSWDHTRYGKDYTGRAAVENWGPIYEGGKVTGWYENKINLVAHSMGGPTATMFLHLLAEGNEAERAWAKKEAAEKGGAWQDYCSPLFWGDYEGEKLVHSLTTLAGVLNGTTFIDSCDDFTEVITDSLMMTANLTGNTLFTLFFNFQLDQFGITAAEDKNAQYVLDMMEASHFLDGRDNAIYDLSIGGCNELKQGWQCYDNVYYFAYAGCTTHEVGGYQLPNINTWVPYLGFATFMGSYTNEKEIVLNTDGSVFGCIDEKWLPNDGMVNTITASYVFGCDHKDWDGVVEPGMWITMPAYGYDHMDYAGGLLEPSQNAPQTKAFYDEVMGNIEATYAREAAINRLAAPTGLTAKRAYLKSKVTLNWKAVDGAVSYKVYRAVVKNGAYSLLGSTDKTTWEDTHALYGWGYYYRIVAVNDNKTVTSPYSESVMAKTVR